MVETREFCDRCGKEVTKGILGRGLMRFVVKKQKVKLFFAQGVGFTELPHEICLDCLRSLNEWYDSGKDGEHGKEHRSDSKREGNI